ncbi:sigma-70 family RNA polymerase sigma factor [Caldicellulosiruptoraceae bacterium PP1]
MKLHFDKIYSKYFDKVKNHIRYIIGDEKDSEDIAQEVFIKMYSNPPNDQNIAAWLFTVAKNLSINFLKSKSSREKREQQYFLERPQLTTLSYNFIETKEILEKLNEMDRNLLILKFSGYSYDEISKILDIDKKQVGVRILRAQKKFKKIYEGEEG